MNNRRVFHCIPDMSGGGCERQLGYLCEGLQQRGWDLHVALLSAGPNYRRLRESGATIHAIDSHGHYDPSILFRLHRLLRAVRPALVQTWNPMMDILGGACASLMGIPWILSENNSASAYPPTWRNRLRQVIGSRSTAIASVSRIGLDYWRPLTCAELYFTPIIPHFAEIEATPPSSTLAEAARHQKVILFAGRFVPEKNVERLVRVLIQIVTERNAVAYLCGDGPLRGRLQAVVDSRGLGDRIQFPGYIDNVAAWMKAADMFVTVSTFEGRPNTVLEAMACKCPIILSDIPTHREIVDGSSAYFCDPLDEDSISVTLRRVIDEPREASDKAAAAYSRISEYSMEEFLTQYEQIYSCAIEAPGKPISPPSPASLREHSSRFKR